jgi:hypothetical protein
VKLPHQFLNDIGPADELSERLSSAMKHNDPQETLFLLLDIARTVKIDRSQRLNDRTVFHATDVEDGASVIIHFPFNSKVAQAAIITYSKGEH